MIDPRLQAVLDSTATPEPTGPIAIGDLVTDTPPEPPPAASTGRPAQRNSSGNVLTAAALRSQMHAQVPGRDKAPEGPLRRVGEWLSAPAEDSPAVTGTSSWFTVNHWHWMAAKGLVPTMPVELGPSFPHLFMSESQIAHDLRAWSALDDRGGVTAEAAAMFGAVSGDADMTLYGTVLLYAHRRAPVTLPAELEEFGLQAAVRDVPRVTFAIGMTEKEVVTALVNNTTVVFARRHRRTDLVPDAAAALRNLLDPGEHWAPYPMTGPVTLPSDTVEHLATGSDTAGVLDSEPSDDADPLERDADLGRRKRIGKAVRTTLRSARIPTGAADDIAGIATATTDALAQVTVRTRDVDVSRGEPAALALAFLRKRGVVVSYPSGSGAQRHITYVSGNVSGIALGITSLRRVFNGG